jgi:hypothetical protein
MPSGSTRSYGNYVVEESWVRGRQFGWRISLMEQNPDLNFISFAFMAFLAEPLLSREVRMTESRGAI